MAFALPSSFTKPNSKTLTYSKNHVSKYYYKSKTRLQVCSAINERDGCRRLADFPINIWQHTTAFHNTLVMESDECESEQIDVMKSKVKEMLIGSNGSDDPAKKISFINTLTRLGVSYHLESQIEAHLKHIYQTHFHQLEAFQHYDLYTTALLFRVFRQHGYKISSLVFEKFMEKDGRLFREDLIDDPKGMLSLYEAAQLRVHGEDILEEAIVFTKAHLPSLAKKTNPNLSKKIINALEMPFHKGMPRLETYKYISTYDDEEEDDEMLPLLKFAKVDFNQVQLLHQQEINQLTSWWRGLDLPSKLPYIRDRIIELYFWSVAIYPEPCYSRARLIFTKVLKIMSILDDTYDSYGTIQELKLFTKALRTWDTTAVHSLPDYMKIIYTSILNLFDELDNEVADEGRSYSVTYTKETLKEMVRGYLQETQWYEEGYEPTFEEYVENAFLTVGSQSISSTAFVGMRMATHGAFQWLQTWPPAVKAAYKIGRLMGDITSHQFEQKRGHVDSGVECYMKQYGVSREETIREFTVMFENAWKDMNEECLEPRSVPLQLLLRVVNIARLVEVTYKEVDGYTNPEYLRVYITKLFIDKIPI